MANRHEEIDGGLLDFILAAIVVLLVIEVFSYMIFGEGTVWKAFMALYEVIAALVEV